MIGRLLEVTGGAQVLADTLISRFGEKRAPAGARHRGAALRPADLLRRRPRRLPADHLLRRQALRRLGPDVRPARRPARSPRCTRSSRRTPARSRPPPSSARASASRCSSASSWRVVAWFVGVYAVTIGPGSARSRPDRRLGARPAAASVDDRTTRPRSAHVLGILLLPLVLIGANTILTTLRTNGTIAEDGGVADALVFIGQTPVALLIALLVATYTLGRPAPLAGRDREPAQRRARPDLRDHPDHRRRRHVRRRAALQRHRRRALGLPRRPRAAR